MISYSLKIPRVAIEAKDLKQVGHIRSRKTFFDQPMLQTFVVLVYFLSIYLFIYFDIVACYLTDRKGL